MFRWDRNIFLFPQKFGVTNPEMDTAIRDDAGDDFADFEFHGLIASWFLGFVADGLDAVNGGEI